MGSAWACHKPAAQHSLDRDLLAKGSTQQIRHSGDEPAQIDLFWIQRLLTRKSKKSLRQRLRAACSPHGMLSGPPKPRRVELRSAEISLQRLKVADDDGKKIIEVVGHAAGELAYSFHLLTLTRTFVGRASLRKISRYFRKTQQLSVSAFDRVNDDACPERAFILAQTPSLGFVFAGLSSDPESPLRHSITSVLGHIKYREMAANNFVATVAFDPRRSRIPIDDVPGRIKHINSVVGHAFDQIGENGARCLRAG